MAFGLMALGGALVKAGAGSYAKKFGHTVLGKGLRGVGIGVAKAAPYVAGAALLSGGNKQVPALPPATMGGVPMPSQFQRVGILPGWRGPQGKFQMPWNDPKVPEFLKQFALDDAHLRVAYRAPKGYVVVRDPNGKPYAIMKSMAKHFGLWKEPAKPPISATDWKHFKRNQQIEKKLLTIAKKAAPRVKRVKVYSSNKKGKC